MNLFFYDFPVQVFNEEQALLASSSQSVRQMNGGIDNPALDIGRSHPNPHSYSQNPPKQQPPSSTTMYNGGGGGGGGKMSGYFPDSASTSSQSQSLSSSNTDSLDTVIYKG